MAKLLLFVFAFALLAASTGGAVAASMADLQQRQDLMEEVIRVSTDPVAAAAADAETMGRLVLFMKRELGPFGIVFNAIDKMPENSVANVRSKAAVLDAAEELLMRHHRLLLGSAKIKDACRQSGRCH